MNLGHMVFILIAFWDFSTSISIIAAPVCNLTLQTPEWMKFPFPMSPAALVSCSIDLCHSDLGKMNSILFICISLIARYNEHFWYVTQTFFFSFKNSIQVPGFIFFEWVICLFESLFLQFIVYFVHQTSARWIDGKYSFPFCKLPLYLVNGLLSVCFSFVLLIS